MNELALFAGGGLGLLGSLLCGWRTVVAVESDEFARSILIRRQDDGILDPFPIWDRVETFDGRPWRGRVDVVTAGFPCQAFSTASRGRKVAVDYWSELVRIVEEVEPQWIVLENVVRDAFPESVRAYLQNACPSSIGAPIRRNRYWLVANRDDSSQSGFALDGGEVACIPATCAGGEWWGGFARLAGMDDRDSDRMDRQRIIGNGQVPGMVRLLWELS